jgi:hypothetical protein
VAPLAMTAAATPVPVSEPVFVVTLGMAVLVAVIVASGG